MLEICIIEEYENMGDFQIGERRIASIDLKEFHAMRRFWQNVSEVCGVSVTYFEDSILRVNDVKLAKQYLLAGNYNHHYVAYWSDIFDICMCRNQGLLFVCD